MRRQAVTVARLISESQPTPGTPQPEPLVEALQALTSISLLVDELQDGESLSADGAQILHEIRDQITDAVERLVGTAPA